MHGRSLTLSSSGLAVVGLVLLAFESIQAMRSVVLGTLGTTLLFAGVGLVVVAGAMLVIAVTTEPVAADTPPAPATPDAPLGSAVPVMPLVTEAAPVTPTLVDTEADAAAHWTLVHRTDCAGRLDAGNLQVSVRRGATLIAYDQGLLIDVGKAQQHRSWAYVSSIAATLGGGQATISVAFSTGTGTAKATFTGKNGDLAPVATALVSAAPAGMVDVTYS